jgi:hypothetical protein
LPGGLHLVRIGAVPSPGFAVQSYVRRNSGPADGPAGGAMEWGSAWMMQPAGRA